MDEATQYLLERTERDERPLVRDAIEVNDAITEQLQKWQLAKEIWRQDFPDSLPLTTPDLNSASEINERLRAATIRLMQRTQMSDRGARVNESELQRLEQDVREWLKMAARVLRYLLHWRPNTKGSLPIAQREQGNGTQSKGSASNLPDPHNTGQRPPGHAAQLGFNLGGMKGGGGALGGGTGGSYGGGGAQGDQPASNGGYGTGYGGGGGLGHDKANEPGPSGTAADVAAQAGADAAHVDPEAPQDLPQPETRGGGGGGGGAGAAPGGTPPAAPPDPQPDDNNQSTDDSPNQSTDTDTNNWLEDAMEKEDAADRANKQNPNPDDGTDESGRMRGLPRYVRRQADKFTGKGAVPAQTSLVYRLLAFSSQGLGEDGGGVNPRFFGADPNSDRSSGRSGRAADPDSGGGGSGLGYGVGATPVNGGDTIGGMQGPVDMSDQAAAAALTPAGPDPDNEWGAGGYNPHYQPAGYAWTPYSRGAAGGATRAAPAQRVSRVAAIRFK
jgi:hypothetical protein